MLTEKLTIEIVPKTLSIEVVPFLMEQPEGSKLIKEYNYQIYFVAHGEGSKPIFYVSVPQGNIKLFLEPYLSCSKIINGVNEFINLLKA